MGGIMPSTFPVVLFSMFKKYLRERAYGHLKYLGRTSMNKRSFLFRVGLCRIEISGVTHFERSNISIRMGNRRFTRLTNAFSKKLENHCHSLALYFVYYNFCKIHKSLSVTPPMQAGLMKKTNDCK